MAKPRSFGEEKSNNGFLVFDAVTARENDFLAISSRCMSSVTCLTAQTWLNTRWQAELIWRQHRIVSQKKRCGSSMRIRLGEF